MLLTNRLTAGGPRPVGLARYQEVAGKMFWFPRNVFAGSNSRFTRVNRL